VNEIRPFNPNSWPTGIRKNTEIEDVSKAIADLDLETAKNAVYTLTGRVSLKLEQFNRIIDKIIKLNAKVLSPEHAKLNYTLEAAHSLGCAMYGLASDDIEVRSALLKISNAHLNKGNYCKAIDVLDRLGHEVAAQYQEPIRRLWRIYIDHDCPADEKGTEELRWRFRFRRFNGKSWYFNDKIQEHADRFVKNGKYQKAIELSEGYRSLIHYIGEKWRTYIDTECPYDKKPVQELAFKKYVL
jgi:hypothetical protein